MTKKVAVCFSGQARAFHHTALNLEYNLIKQLQSYGHEVSIFVHIAEDQFSQNWEVLSDMGCPVSALVEPDVFIEMAGIEHAQRTGDAQGLFQMHRSWYKANELMLAARKNFDYVIRTRLDIRFFEPILDIAQYNVDKVIYVPDFHNFSCVFGSGVNDRFAFGNMENITLYTNLTKYAQLYARKGHIFHAESTLSYHLRETKIKVEHLPIRFTRVRPTGEELDNRLKEPKEKWNEIDK